MGLFNNIVDNPIFFKCARDLRDQSDEIDERTKRQTEVLRFASACLLVCLSACPVPLVPSVPFVPFVSLRDKKATSG